MIKKKLMGRITMITMLCFMSSASVHAKATANGAVPVDLQVMHARNDLGWG